MTTTLTEKELAVIKAFAKTEYGEGDGKQAVWMFSILEHSELSPESFSGVCSSLHKKGLIGSDTIGDKGSYLSGVKIEDTYTIWLTEKGIEEFSRLTEEA